MSRSSPARTPLGVYGGFAIDSPSSDYNLEGGLVGASPECLFDFSMMPLLRHQPDNSYLHFMNRPDLVAMNGLVLAGGHSLRMGRDKGGIIVHGIPQREYLLQELAPVCKDVYTSCRHDQQLPPSVRPIVDAFNVGSPLNGILSAFKLSPDTAWLAVAVDMPNVNRNVFKLLANRRDLSKAATCFYNDLTKLPEPLLTIWEPAAYPSLLEFIEAGRKSPRDFLSLNDVKIVHTTDTSIFYNMNTPDDVL
jgi:molybdenum cofactor guanylyltransferase